MINISNGSSFKDSGIATTNHLGEFLFIIAPPSASAGSSHINVRAEHRSLGNLQTKLILSPKSIQNIGYEIYEALSFLMNDIEIYNFDIVMKGEV